MAEARETILFLSAFQDYRTAKKASIQQVADGLVRAGYRVSFVSMRFSLLSRLTGDSRLFLNDRANRVEEVNGVRCYLWRTMLHPFASRFGLVNAVTGALYPFYARMHDASVDAMIREADHVIVESSAAALLIRRVKALNPHARIIYYATDRLDTVGAHRYVQQRLLEDAAAIDHVCIRSRGMAEHFAWARDRLFLAEFGVDAAILANVGQSPYTNGRAAAVSVGSMLFDAQYFLAVAEHFPQVDFHVIGGGARFDAPANVIQHAEMPFAATLPYIKHATIGIAPYRDAPGVEYLSESSLKLAQYEYFGLPAACPDFAAGSNPARAGYRPGDAATMVAATARALAMAGTVTPRQFPSWDEVGVRILHPQRDPTLRVDVPLVAAEPVNP